MDIAKGDAFETASRCLERLAQLKEKELLENAEYEELRGLLISEMKRSASFPEERMVEPSKPSERLQVASIPYGQLHSQIVQKIASTYESAGANAKQRVFRAMAEMAEKQALYPGDSTALTELVETVFAPLEGPVDDSTGVASRQLVEIQRSLIGISATIRDAKEASPAAKAIADTALQSTTRAAAEFPVERSKAEARSTPLLSFWGRFVLKDVEGAFEGGAAAVTVAPAFAAAFPVALPVAAAFGVVVGAGVRSAIAYAERGV
jgi:hypothetical protein